MRYVKGMIDLRHYYGGDHDYRLYGCYSLGSAMISWFSRKQSSVSLSMTEAEYIAACYASCEAIWLRKLMSGLFNLELDTTMILCDNQSCIKMT